MKRREFITLLGGAAATWPVVAVAQRRIPVIGFISSISPEELAEPVAGFHKGLGEAGLLGACSAEPADRRGRRGSQ